MSIVYLLPVAEQDLIRTHDDLYQPEGFVQSCYQCHYVNMDAMTNTIYHAADDIKMKISYTQICGAETVTMACIHGIFPTKCLGTPTTPY